MSTPHNKAEQSEIAETVLLPGDPMRAKYIAEKFLTQTQICNDVRGMLGYTGLYRGKRVTVQGTGMGMPSASIYVNELLQFYGVKTLIRVGTCGSILPDIRLKDIIIATAASSDSGINRQRFGDISFAPAADFGLLCRASEFAEKKALRFRCAGVFSSDLFYDDRIKDRIKLLTAYGVAAIDMETCEIYTLAARYHASALSLLTVSDCVPSGERCTTEERQSAFKDMVELALAIL